MDNTEPMWSQDSYGNYWLVFPNKHALSNEAITEIFSEYGNVLKISAAGDERGLRFVQYATSLEAERAVNNLRKHPDVKLVPYRPKNHKKDQYTNNLSDNKESHTNSERQTVNDHVRRNFYQRKPQIKKNNDNLFDDKESNFTSPKEQSDCNQVEKNVYRENPPTKESDTQSQKSFADNSSILSQTADSLSGQCNNDSESVCSNSVSQYFNSNETTPTKSIRNISSLSSISSTSTSKRLMKLKHCINTDICLPSVDVIHDIGNIDSLSSISSTSTSKRLMKLKHCINTNINLPSDDVIADIGNIDSLSSISSTSTSKRLMKLKHCINTNINLPSDDVIPDLVIKSKRPLDKKPKTVVLDAEEVIVGNLHESITSAYILHLFDSFEPLAISYMNVIPNTKIKYCSVYFKTQQDSIEVEKQFDNYDLRGKKLVVLRMCRLMVETMGF